MEDFSIIMYKMKEYWLLIIENNLGSRYLLDIILIIGFNSVVYDQAIYPARPGCHQRQPSCSGRYCLALWLAGRSGSHYSNFDAVYPRFSIYLSKMSARLVC